MFSDSEKASLSIIRIWAMLSIVVCHLFQAYHHSLAGVFNVGVQVFLVLSGYLYGRKQIDDWRQWWKRRFDRVYIPYFIFLSCTIPLYFFFHPEAMRWEWLPVYYLNLDGFRYLLGHTPIGQSISIDGLRHVWFLTAIMFAYFSTYGLQKIRAHSHERPCLVVLSILVGLGYLFLPMRVMFTLAWVYLYAFGYLLSGMKDAASFKVLLLLILTATIVYTLITRDIFFWSPTYRLLHDAAGIAAVVVGVPILSALSIKRLPPALQILDRYSFHIYLVHFIVMCGPFSMAHLTPSVAVNIFLMLSATAILTYLLAWATPKTRIV